MYSSEGTFEINQESFFFSLKVVSTNYQLGRVESRDKFIPNLPLKKIFVYFHFFPCIIENGGSPIHQTIIRQFKCFGSQIFSSQ